MILQAQNFHLPVSLVPHLRPWNVVWTCPEWQKRFSLSLTSLSRSLSLYLSLSLFLSLPPSHSFLFHPLLLCKTRLHIHRDEPNEGEKEAVLFTLQVHFRINKDFTWRGRKIKPEFLHLSFYKLDLSETNVEAASVVKAKRKKGVSFLRSIY